MICASCGTENVAGRRFCDECGAPFAAACPHCGATDNRPTAKFCGTCGGALRPDAIGPVSMGAAPAPQPLVAQPPVAHPSPQPTAERRLVSVLFADLVGFTPFAEEKDPEEVRETLSRYFEIARDVIERYGGTVEKFIGDAVMAVWGAPVAREDDAERAVRAALELVDSVHSLGPAIQARVGVMTGEAAVTLGAAGQGLVAGDLVNTASRLQSVAGPGSVLVGEATMHATSAAVAFEEAGEQSLKGKTAPVAAWRALRVVAERGGRGRADLPEPPFVGRDEELRLLKDLLTATGRDPKARLVSITGSAGIGKSRIAWELEKYADGIAETVYWHRGRSPSYGEGISFWALGEMVRRRAGLAENDDAATTGGRIAETVAEFITDDEDRRWVEPALLTLLGVEPSPAGGRDTLFAAWRIFFERIAERGTTVLLFEDLQWADTGLLDFIEHLLAWARNAPILVITLARPELSDRRPGWGTTARSLTTLALEPLPDEAMRRLLDGFVPGLPDQAAAAILSRADGIPLYAVETVRALVADGRLEMVEGTYRPTGDLADVAIPDTLRSLITSRLDALETADRSLIQAAAVLGQTFTLDGLAATTSAEPNEVEARLAPLVRRELLSLQLDPRSPERGQYAFVQSLIREVAYATLARRDRRERHLAVARWYESLGDEEFAGALASHYVEAHQASAPGPEAEAVAIQARLALGAAAERAASLGAHDQAVAYLRQAVDVTTDLAEQAELMLRAARSADAASRYDEGLEFVERSAAVYGAVGDRTNVARARALHGAILLDAGNVAEARLVLDGALADLGEDADETVRAELLSNLSRALMRAGDDARAIAVADQALAIAERLDLELIVAETFNNRGSSLGALGRRREAIALLEAAVRGAQAGGFVGAELRARANLSTIVFYDDPRRELEDSRTALALARRVGHRMMANWLMTGLLASIYFTADDWAAGLADGEEVLAAVTGPADEAKILVYLTLIRIARGEPTDEAMRRLEELTPLRSDPASEQELRILRADRAIVAGALDDAYEEAMAGADLFVGLAARCLTLAGHAALSAGDPHRARTVADRLDRLPSSGRLVDLRRVGLSGGITALEGRPAEAIGTYRDVIARMRERGGEFEAATLALELAILVGTADPVVRGLAEDARAVFERVGAVPWVARLEAAIAGPPIAGAMLGQGRTAPDAVSETAAIE